jgi:hypothetical protein
MIDFLGMFFGVFCFLLLTAACVLVDVTLFLHSHWILGSLAVCATVALLVATAAATE